MHIVELLEYLILIKISIRCLNNPKINFYIVGQLLRFTVAIKINTHEFFNSTDESIKIRTRLKIETIDLNSTMFQIIINIQTNVLIMESV